MEKYWYEYGNNDDMSAAGFVRAKNWLEAKQWLQLSVKLNGGWGWIEHPETLERHAINCVLPRTKPRYSFRHLWRCPHCRGQTSAELHLMDSLLTDDLDHRHLRIDAVTEVAYCRRCETPQREMIHLGIFPDVPGGVHTAGWYDARIDLPNDGEARLTRVYASDAADAYVEFSLLATPHSGDVYCDDRRINDDGTLLDD